MRLRSALPLAVAAACAHSRARSETVLSLRELDCESCGATVLRILEGQDGVADARFDRDKVEVAVRYDATRTAPETLAAAVREAGYACVAGAGSGSYATEVEFDGALDVQWIARRGEEVDVRAHLAAGKVTVVDFYAPWCGPCRDVDRAMKEILAAGDDVALRKVDVADWESPAARRYLRDVPSLPYVEVYDRRGARVDAIAGLDLVRLRRAIEQARDSGTGR